LEFGCLQGFVFVRLSDAGGNGDNFDVGPDFLDLGDARNSAHAGYEDIDDRQIKMDAGHIG